VTPRRVALWATVCVALAAACRFALFDLIEFKYDEAQVSSYALDLVRHHVIAQTSILTSGGFHNPPAMVYLAAIPMLVSASPLAVTAFFTALNGLAAGGLYLAGRRLFGDVAALAAAILYAVGPLAVHYSRKIWAPDAMPPFTVLLFAGLALGLTEGQPWWLAAALVALAVLVQLHQAAIVLLPAAVLLLAAFAWRGRPPGTWRRGATWGGLLVGLAGFVLLLLPYAIYERQHQFADLRGMLGQVSARPALTFVPWRDLWWLTAGWNPQLFFADLAAQERPPLTGSNALDWAMLALGLVGIGTCLLRLVRPDAAWPGAKAPPPDAGRVAAATLLLLTFLPPLVIMRSAAPVYPHYLVFLLPLLFLLVGIGISTIAHLLRRPRLPPWAPPLSAGVITAVLVLGSLLRLAGFDRQLTQHTTGGDYGTPLRYSLQAAQAMGEHAVTGPAHRSFLMASDGDTLAVYGYLATAGIAPAATPVQPEQALLLPATGGSDYLFTGAATAAYQTLRTAGAGILALPPSAPAYTILRLGAEQSPSNAGQLLPAAQPVGPFQIGPGLVLSAAQTSFGDQAGPLNVALAWTVADPSPFARQPVKMFVHLYDAARHTVAQEDALGAAASTWQRGDRLLTWFTATPAAPLPPGRYGLVAGVYTVDGLHVFPVRGPHGEDLGGEIPLGTVTVGAP
jgi:4-amino-4-deoxy-L-arabinose transferase-like glycosyltransferase